ARVVPAASGVHWRPGRERTVGCPTVELVTLHVEPGVMAAPLLSHELQKLIGQFAERVNSDAEGKRPCRSELQSIAPGLAESCEVEFGVVGERPPVLRQDPSFSFEDHRTRRR